MLAREYCESAGIKLKPIILSHHMLYGLSKGQAKMSKSNKESAIFMEDSEEDVRRKISNAYCPMKPESVETRPEEEQMQLVDDPLKNPCLDYIQYIIFSHQDASFTAGGSTFRSPTEVREAFVAGQLTEDDLKAGLIAAINQLLEPVRSHFRTNDDARRILQLITGWMQEPKAVQGCKLRRLVAIDDNRPTCVVYAPLATDKPTLRSALDTLRCLAAAPTSCVKVLWIKDWSAFTLNCLSGGKTRDDDLKAISAASRLFIAALQALAPDVMKDVVVKYQSEVRQPHRKRRNASTAQFRFPHARSGSSRVHRRCFRTPTTTGYLSSTSGVHFRFLAFVLLKSIASMPGRSSLRSCMLLMCLACVNPLQRRASARHPRKSHFTPWHVSTCEGRKLQRPV